MLWTRYGQQGCRETEWRLSELGTFENPPHILNLSYPSSACFSLALFDAMPGKIDGLHLSSSGVFTFAAILLMKDTNQCRLVDESKDQSIQNLIETSEKTRSLSADILEMIFSDNTSLSNSSRILRYNTQVLIKRIHWHQYASSMPIRMRFTDFYSFLVSDFTCVHACCSTSY